MQEVGEVGVRRSLSYLCSPTYRVNYRIYVSREEAEKGRKGKVTQSRNSRIKPIHRQESADADHMQQPSLQLPNAIKIFLLLTLYGVSPFAKFVSPGRNSMTPPLVQRL